jgi:hypothetical protein
MTFYVFLAVAFASFLDFAVTVGAGYFPFGCTFFGGIISEYLYFFYISN